MNELAVRNQVVSTYDEVERAAKAMVASGFFADTKAISQAVVKILAGQEIGFGPFASMSGVYIIQGKPSFGANIMAAAVKASGRYNYRVTEMTEQACEIAFFENGQQCGSSRFTIEDAKKAGTKNLDKFARNMLFARAMSNGVRWYCPDVMNGSAVYTPEELGVETDEDGKPLDTIITAEVVEITPVEVDDEEPFTLEDAFKVTNSEGESYGEIPSVKLSHMSKSINLAKKSNGKTPLELAELDTKLKAIEVILQARSNGEIPNI